MEDFEISKMFRLERSHWWFLARRKLALSFLKRYCKNKKTLLDVGCGTGENLINFKKIIPNSQGLDIDPLCIEFCKKRGLKVISGEAEKLPFKTNSIDVISALDIFEHVSDDRQAIKECFRVLKNNGILIFSMPAFRLLWTEHDKIMAHKRRYTMKEVSSKLKKEGFQIKKISYWNFMLFLPSLFYKLANKKSHIQPAGLITNEILFQVLCLDNLLIKYFKLPFGVSIFGVTKKIIT